MNIIDSIPQKPEAEKEWVRESRFGRWFLTTNIWLHYVLHEAVVDLKQLLGNRITEIHQILDVGCHQGLAFELLEQHFQPRTIIGVDIDKEQVSLALGAAQHCQCQVKCQHGTVYHLDLPDNSVDVIFCHQLLHHLSDQESALEELYRVLAPSGVLLIGESCRSFIHSFSVRLLFRHPKNVQKTAPEFVALVKSCGFKVRDEDIRTSRPWWSRKDFGLTELLGLPQKQQEATEVLMVARKLEETIGVVS